MPTYSHLSGASIYAPTVTASGSANTKGSYTELTASTPFSSSRCWFHITALGNALRKSLTDLASGAGGAEVVILANVHAADASDVNPPGSLFCQTNLDIPASTRLAARTQNSTGSGTVFPMVLLEDRDIASLSGATTYGADTSTSRGTQIDPGAVVDTKGSYTQLTAASAAAHTFLQIITGLNANATATSCVWNVDISTGAGGAEVVIIPDLVYHEDPDSDNIFPMFRGLTVNIPISTRVAVRAQCTITDATDRLFDIELIGMQDARDVVRHSVLDDGFTGVFEGLVVR